MPVKLEINEDQQSVRDVYLHIKDKYIVALERLKKPDLPHHYEFNDAIDEAIKTIREIK